MAPGQPSLKGKQAIREMLEGTSKIPGFKISWDPKMVSVSKSGDMAYMIEETQITMNDSLGKPFTEYNKAVTVWRKEANGTWKNVIDMWNANPIPNK
jgi:ketosteroid isomerase-like protein